MAVRDIEESSNSSTPSRETKRRRVQGSCDICRRRKVKCDSARMPNNRCTNCITAQLNCTHYEAIKSWGPAQGYIENLENRVKLLETILQKIAPHIDINNLSDISESSCDKPVPAKKSWSTPTTIENPFRPLSLISDIISTEPPVISGTADPEPEPELEILLPSGDSEPDSLLEKLSNLTLDPPQHRFHGESSGINLVKTAYHLKSELTRSNGHTEPARLGTKRHEFWDNPAWEALDEVGEPPRYSFPDDDLIISLVDLYFIHINLLTPLLHRPTFERAVQDNLHLRDHMFGATLLLVCALGSHFSDDPRIFLEGANSYSRGWKWFSQVQLIRTNMHPRASLYELQMYSLWNLFSRRSSRCQGCWIISGIGLRLAQEVGAHRRKSRTKAWTVEDELWKRAFWVLFAIDRDLSILLGRPCGIPDEEIDLDLPLECDDEFWESSDPDLAFKQPAGQPSTVAYFNLSSTLRQISSLALRTIYSIRKPHKAANSGQFSDQHVITELDSALNKWIDSVPDHLRWDPHREHNIFFNQSAALYANYYHTQILVHRPYISSPRSSSFPSLAICTNAARLCSHVIEVQRRRNKFPLQQMQNAAFVSGIVLLLNIWTGKRSGLSIDYTRDIDGVYKCMQYLKISEKRRSSSGRYWDMLAGLASAGDLPLESLSPSTNKRLRDEPDSDSHSPSSSYVIDEPRIMAGSRRLTSRLSQDQGRSPQNMFALPTHSSELGRLPVYGQFNEGTAEESTFNPEWFADLMSVPQAFDDAIAPYSTSEGFAGQSSLDADSLDQYFYDHLATEFSSTILPNRNTDLQDDGMNVSYNNGDPLPFMDNDVMSVWDQTPIGLDMEGWGTYITTLDSLTRNPGD